MLTPMKTFHDLANAFIEKDISAMFPEVWDLARIALCVICIFRTLFQCTKAQDLSKKYHGTID